MTKEIFATVITGIFVIEIMAFLIWEIPQIDLVVQEMRNKWMKIAFKSITSLEKNSEVKTKENYTGKMHQYLLLTVTSGFSAFMIADILARSIGLGY